MSSYPSNAPIGQRLRRILPHFQKAKGAMIMAAIATAVVAATEPMMPALLKQLLDRGFGKGELPLWMVPVALMGLFAIRGVAMFLAQYALSYTANIGIFQMRQAMFAKLNAADLSLFSRQSASKLSNTLVYEVQSGSTMLVNSMLTLTKDSLSLVALMAYLLYLNWKLTLIVLTIFPALVLVMRVLSKRLYRLTRNSQTATDELAYVVEENALAHRMVRLHGAQPLQTERFETLAQALNRLAIKATIAFAAMTPITQLLAAGALSAVITIALWQSNETGITVGNFVAFVTAMLMLIAPVRHLASVAGPITRGLAALERGQEMIDNTEEQVGGTYGPEAAIKGAVHLEGVWVRYKTVRDGESPAYETQTQPEMDRAALRNISLEIAPGQITALVGPSGSGKSTLANLLPRFVDVAEGTVTLDGVALPQWDLSSLRRQIGMVSQDVVMLNDTLAANVALGFRQSEIDDEKVLAALQSANLGDLVQALPKGIHSGVGHNATELSGGQRQRLAIARAIYKDAPILILDEATSALDNESERLVQEALGRLMQGRTTLVIAHRLSTIEHADRVVVLNHGRIVEDGTHAQLIRANGLYARLHAQGFSEQPGMSED